MRVKNLAEGLNEFDGTDNQYFMKDQEVTMKAGIQNYLIMENGR
jgi:hypothetical protein